jgi:hypothetical protein
MTDFAGLGQAGTKNRPANSSSPSDWSNEFSRSACARPGRSWCRAMISSFFIECSQPTSSVTLTW